MATTMEFYIYQKNPYGIQAEQRRGVEYMHLYYGLLQQAKKFNIELLNGRICIRV